MKDVEPVNERILVLKMKGSPEVNFVAAYAPTAMAEEAKKNGFWNRLKRIQKELDKAGPTFLMGDLNARVQVALEGEEDYVGGAHAR